VARHERSFARYEQVLALEHYLDVLLRKPGALAGSLRCSNARERGHWRRSFDQVVASLQTPRGQAGWNPKHDRVVSSRAANMAGKKLKQAVRQALDIGCTDGGSGNGTFLVFGETGARCSGKRLAVGGLERLRTPVAGDEPTTIFC